MSERNAKGQFIKGHSYGVEFQFKKGHTTWNKGTKGIMKPNSGSFTHEKVNEVGLKSIGVERDYGKRYGCVCLSEERKMVYNSKDGKWYNSRKRIPYARHVLNQAGIEIPKGCVVYHKDGDYKNNELSNLEVISRGELLKRNTK